MTYCRKLYEIKSFPYLDFPCELTKFQSSTIKTNVHVGPSRWVENCSPEISQACVEANKCDCLHLMTKPEITGLILSLHPANERRHYFVSHWLGAILGSALDYHSHWHHISNKIQNSDMKNPLGPSSKDFSNMLPFLKKKILFLQFVNIKPRWIKPINTACISISVLATYSYVWMP